MYSIIKCKLISSGKNNVIRQLLMGERMKKSASKMLVMLMTLILIVAMMPLTAFAVDDSAEGVASVPVPAEPENGIPLIVINVDEQELYTDEKGDTYGSIQDMNESEDHSVRCKGSVDILVPEGYRYGYGDSVLKPDAETGRLLLSYIRGRGNSTWTNEKKPYKIKFKSGQDLFGMGKSKEWGLIANASDTTLMKNRIISWLGEQMGLQFTPQMVPVDVVMKGSYGSETYLGSYCLSELIDVEENRVNINDGYLISLYNASQDADEPQNSVFKTDAGVEYFIRTPEFKGDDISDLTEDQKDQRDYISKYIQDIEDLIMKPEAIDEETHNRIGEMMDLTSLADYWLIQEFSKNGDAFFTSSTYMYKDRDGKLCWGPLWDFDASLGSQIDEADSIDEYEEDISGFNSSWFPWITVLRERDPLFRDLLEERWKVMDGKLAELTVYKGVIDKFRDEVAESQVKNSLLWPDLPSTAEDADQYKLAIKKQKKWINQRREWFNDNFDALEKATITITYTVDGKTVKTEKVRENASEGMFDPPEAPAKAGKSFLGWYCEEEQQYLGGYTVEKDTEFAAKYINDSDVINPSAIYLSRREDWADLQTGEYPWVSEASFVPEEVTFKEVTWSSSDDGIATVDEYGKVQLKGIGNVVIKATHRSGKSASYTLHVYDSTKTEARKITGARFDTSKIDMKSGDVTQVRWTLEPEGQVIRNTAILFESEDESVASVDYSGVVTARNPGTTVITIHVMPVVPGDDEAAEMITAACKVTVSPKMKGTEITKLKRSSKAITVKWKKQTAMVESSRISGYQVQLATNKKFTRNKRTVTVKGYKKTSKKIKKLKGRKKYYVRVRTYKVFGGKKYYSSWSKIRHAETKK